MMTSAQQALKSPVLLGQPPPQNENPRAIKSVLTTALDSLQDCENEDDMYDRMGDMLKKAGYDPNQRVQGNSPKMSSSVGQTLAEVAIDTLRQCRTDDDLDAAVEALMESVAAENAVQKRSQFKAPAVTANGVENNAVVKDPVKIGNTLEKLRSNGKLSTDPTALTPEEAQNEAILREIMAQEKCNFGEAFDILVRRQMIAAGIDPDTGLPIDPKMTSFDSVDLPGRKTPNLEMSPCPKSVARPAELPQPKRPEMTLTPQMSHPFADITTVDGMYEQMVPEASRPPQPALIPAPRPTPAPRSAPPPTQSPPQRPASPTATPSPQKTTTGFAPSPLASTSTETDSPEGNKMHEVASVRTERRRASSSSIREEALKRLATKEKVITMQKDSGPGVVPESPNTERERIASPVAAQPTQRSQSPATEKTPTEPPHTNSPLANESHGSSLDSFSVAAAAPSPTIGTSSPATFTNPTTAPTTPPTITNVDVLPKDSLSKQDSRDSDGPGQDDGLTQPMSRVARARQRREARAAQAGQAGHTGKSPEREDAATTAAATATGLPRNKSRSGPNRTESGGISPSEPTIGEYSGETPGRMLDLTLDPDSVFTTLSRPSTLERPKEETIIKRNATPSPAFVASLPPTNTVAVRGASVRANKKPPPPPRRPPTKLPDGRPVPVSNEKGRSRAGSVKKRLTFVEVVPDDFLIFDLTRPDASLSQAIQVTNPTDQPVAYKIKTTTAQRYAVRPNQGMVDPKTTVHVNVSIRKDVAPNYADKFLVQSIPSNPGCDVKALWAETPKEQVGQYRFICKVVKGHLLVPPTVTLEGVEGREIKGQISLSNKGPQPVLFRAEPIARKDMVFTPNHGTVQPGASLELAVTLPEATRDDQKATDLTVIKTMVAKGDAPPVEQWRKALPQDLGETVVRCTIQLQNVAVAAMHPAAAARREASQIAIQKALNLEAMKGDVKVPRLYRPKGSDGPDRQREMEQALLHHVELKDRELQSLRAANRPKDRLIEQLVEQLATLHYDHIKACRTSAAMRTDAMLLRARLDETEADSETLRRQLHDLVGQQQDALAQKSELLARVQRKESELEAAEQENLRLMDVLDKVEKSLEQGTHPDTRAARASREGNSRNRLQETESTLKAEKRLRREAEERLWEAEQELRRMQRENVELLGRMRAREREADVLRTEVETLRERASVSLETRQKKATQAELRAQMDEMNTMTEGIAAALKKTPGGRRKMLVARLSQAEAAMEQMQEGVQRGVGEQSAEEVAKHMCLVVELLREVKEEMERLHMDNTVLRGSIRRGTS